ncbi:hypothetical protein WN944_029460 [Citrus x changshan-huyou]|uniref:Uncharacterized protein n=1 Tax=Citrus x changshan-huyou TaxID=2935761 RepID=A0AAP0QB42_9ROSI
MYLEVICWSFQLIDCNFASTFVKDEDVKAREIEGYTVRALPTRQRGYVVLTTPDGVLDHEEALRRTQNISIKLNISLQECLKTEDCSMIRGDNHLQAAYARGNNKHPSTLDVTGTSTLPIDNPQVL